MWLSEVIPIIAIIATFGTFFGVAYLFFMTRHRERLALIEKGADASIFKQEDKGMSALKWGLLLMGGGLGLLIGLLVGLGMQLGEDLTAGITFGSIFIFGGLGLVIYYNIARKREKEREAEAEM